MFAVRVSSVHYSYPPGPVILNSREIYYPVVRARGTQIQFPAPPRRLTAICNSSSKGSGALFWLAQALHAVVHRHTGRRKAQTQKIKIRTILWRVDWVRHCVSQWQDEDPRDEHIGVQQVECPVLTRLQTQRPSVSLPHSGGVGLLGGALV